MFGAVLFFVSSLAAFITLSTILGTEVFHMFFHDLISLQNSIFSVTTFVIVAGAMMFFLAQYLLRYGVGIAIRNIASLLYNYPVTTQGLLFTLFYAITGLWGIPQGFAWGIIIFFSILSLFEEKIIKKVEDFERRKNQEHLGFATTRSRTRKSRETWTLLACLAAWPRWAGGFFQKLMSPVMQQIVELGPFSIFAKEGRAHEARFYTSARLAALFIILMPISTIFGFSPFQGVVLKLAAMGIYFNQVLVLMGLVTFLKAQGFNRVSAIIGAGFGLSVGWILWGSFNPALFYLGFWLGGFIKGFSRWLYNRGLDSVRFPIQLIIHTLGQRLYQSIKFELGGDKTYDYRGRDIKSELRAKYPKFLNIRNIWLWYGIGLYLLFLVSLTFQSIFTNVLLLFPFLMVPTGILVGLFVSNVPKGKATKWRYVARLAGWAVGAGVLLGLRELTIIEGVVAYVPVFVLVFIFTALFMWAYIENSEKLDKLPSGLKFPDSLKDKISYDAQRKLLIFRGVMSKEEKKNLLGLSEDKAYQKAIERLFQKFPIKLIRRITEIKLISKIIDYTKQSKQVNELTSRRRRIISDFSRAFVLSLFCLNWFFWVPVYRALNIEGFNGEIYTIFFTDILRIILAVVGGVIILRGLGRLTECIESRYFNNMKKEGLRASYVGLFREFIENWREWDPYTISQVENLLTETLNCIDQKAHRYATQCLEKTRGVVREAHTNTLDIPQNLKEKTRIFSELHAGGDQLRSPTFQAGGVEKATNLLMEWVDFLEEKLGSDTMQLSGVGKDELKEWLELLAKKEDERKISLWHPVQLVIDGKYHFFVQEVRAAISKEEKEILDSLLIHISEDEVEPIMIAFHMRRWIYSMMIASGGWTYPQAINHMEKAFTYLKYGRAKEVIFQFLSNKYADHVEKPSRLSLKDEKDDLVQRLKLSYLIEILTGCKAQIIHDSTPFGWKSGYMTGMDLSKDSQDLEAVHITDNRNNTVYDLETFMEKDVEYMLTSPNLVNIIPRRDVLNIRTMVSEMGQLVEGGHGAALDGAMILGGKAGESIATGWANIMRVATKQGIDAFRFGYPLRPLTPRYEDKGLYATNFGLQVFIPHGIGISEDIWACEQQAYQLISSKGAKEIAEEDVLNRPQLLNNLIDKIEKLLPEEDKHYLDAFKQKQEVKSLLGLTKRVKDIIERLERNDFSAVAEIDKLMEESNIFEKSQTKINEIENNIVSLVKELSKALSIEDRRSSISQLVGEIDELKKIMYTQLKVLIEDRLPLTRIEAMERFIEFSYVFNNLSNGNVMKSALENIVNELKILIFAESVSNDELKRIKEEFHRLKELGDIVENILHFIEVLSDEVKTMGRNIVDSLNTQLTNLVTNRDNPQEIKKAKEMISRYKGLLATIKDTKGFIDSLPEEVKTTAQDIIAALNTQLTNLV
ncbi:MAG: hypothetical protein DRN07_05220, partial [Thermoplasmata archaeon]